MELKDFQELDRSEMMETVSITQFTKSWVVINIMNVLEDMRTVHIIK